MYRLKGKQPQQPKPFLLTDIRKYVLWGDNLIIASIYPSFDNLSIHIAIQKNEGHYVSTSQVTRKCKIQKNRILIPKNLWLANLSKCLFPDSLLKTITVYFTPKKCCMKNRVAKEHIGTFYLMEKYYKEINFIVFQSCLEQKKAWKNEE